MAIKFAEYLKSCMTDAKNRLEKYGVDAVKSGTVGQIEFSQKLSMLYDTSSIKTVVLSKTEYAHVMSEIATNLTELEKKMPVVTKAIGSYQYTFENHGFGDYRIIKKVPIDNTLDSLWGE